MKKIFFSVLCTFLAVYATAQDSSVIKKEALRSEYGNFACNCIDSINIDKKSKEEVIKLIHDCIEKQTGTYQLVALFADLDTTKNFTIDKNGKKSFNISLDINPNSEQHKKYYYELESYLMDSCPVLKQIIATNNKVSENSISKNPAALDAYQSGQDEYAKGNFPIAVIYFKKAVAADSNFVFAWDNLGLCYRKSGQDSLAIKAYNKSLEINPSGEMPLQNIAIAYRGLKDYADAIKAYERLASVNPDNPEVPYGIGQIYTFDTIDYEKGLDYMCKAYNLYIEQNSPYRTDAESTIRQIYAKMKEQGKEEKFKEILQQNNIGTTDK